ncbi:hypothetical protein CANARDRAFT_5541 [[Candida] arabinofermentans NRRL YB-2248]|uniref:Uncharacterized protein n=1 Tax=[Candida] arabinofermentans NRRL YB-2248 TaxID=983967 RepID=A0A1E4T900_9ASCO|nr:hypothetical protein CANARDRAFT_5541 [[Candida] arabinofermentans NRRL YB-2248]
MSSNQLQQKADTSATKQSSTIAQPPPHFRHIEPDSLPVTVDTLNTLNRFIRYFNEVTRNGVPPEIQDIYQEFKQSLEQAIGSIETKFESESEAPDAEPIKKDGKIYRNGLTIEQRVLRLERMVFPNKFNNEYFHSGKDQKSILADVANYLPSVAILKDADFNEPANEYELGTLGLETSIQKDILIARLIPRSPDAHFNVANQVKEDFNYIIRQLRIANIHPSNWHRGLRLLVPLQNSLLIDKLQDQSWNSIVALAFANVNFNFHHGCSDIIFPNCSSVSSVVSDDDFKDWLDFLDTHTFLSERVVYTSYCKMLNSRSMDVSMVKPNWTSNDYAHHMSSYVLGLDHLGVQFTELQFSRNSRRQQLQFE